MQVCAVPYHTCFVITLYLLPIQAHMSLLSPNNKNNWILASLCIRGTETNNNNHACVTKVSMRSDDGYSRLTYRIEWFHLIILYWPTQARLKWHSRFFIALEYPVPYHIPIRDIETTMNTAFCRRNCFRLSITASKTTFWAAVCNENCWLSSSLSRAREQTVKRHNFHLRDRELLHFRKYKKKENSPCVTHKRFYSIYQSKNCKQARASSVQCNHKWNTLYCISKTENAFLNLLLEMCKPFSPIYKRHPSIHLPLSSEWTAQLSGNEDILDTYLLVFINLDESKNKSTGCLGNCNTLWPLSTCACCSLVEHGCVTWIRPVRSHCTGRIVVLFGKM